MPERAIDLKLRRRVVAFAPSAAMLREIAAEPLGLLQAERYMRRMVEAAMRDIDWYPAMPSSIREVLDELPDDDRDLMYAIATKAARDAKIDQFTSLVIRKAGLMRTEDDA